MYAHVLYQTLMFQLPPPNQPSGMYNPQFPVGGYQGAGPAPQMTPAFQPVLMQQVPGMGGVMGNPGDAGLYPGQTPVGPPGFPPQFR